MAARHDVCVVAFRWPDQRGEPPAGVELHDLEPPPSRPLDRARDRALSVFRHEPVDALRLCGPVGQMVERLRAGRQFDIAHVMLGVLAGIAPALSGLPAVVAPLDAWSINAAAAHAHAAGARRMWLRLQHRIVARYLAHAYRPFARVVLVTPEDARETARLDPTLCTTVIHNGVDTEHFRAGGVHRDRRLLLFTGTLSFPPNAQAARFLATEVLPRVRRQLPDARLAIVGRSPGADVRALARRPGVSVRADVPDLRPHLTEAGVFACGMTSGTGIKNKLLEAMSCGAPAVATPLACQGLAVRDGVELLIANDGDAFAAAAIRILTTDALAARLAEAARRYVVEHHSWASVAARYEALYHDVIAANRPAFAARGWQ